MLFVIRRGMLLTPALAITLGLGLVMAKSARADGLLLQHTIPREVDAYDFTTGRPFMAPPVPYGHYAKDYVADAQKAVGCVTCRLNGLMGGSGLGHSLFHKGDGAGGGCGHGGGCAGGGIGCASGHGLFGHHGGSSSDIYDGTDGLGAGSAGYATTVGPSSQAVALPSGQSICGSSGCDIAAKHSHLSRMLNKIRCVLLRRGDGCGACAGTGATGLCGDPGCGSQRGSRSWQGIRMWTVWRQSGARAAYRGPSLVCTASLRRVTLCNEVQDLVVQRSRRASPDHPGLCPVHRDHPFASRFLQLPHHLIPTLSEK